MLSSDQQQQNDDHDHNIKLNKYFIFTFVVGVKCNTICETGHYGSECSSVCYCEHGSCDPHTGGCLCSRGFSGPKCDIPCSPGFYGVNCRQACPPCNSSKCSITLIIAITVTVTWMTTLSMNMITKMNIVVPTVTKWFHPRCCWQFIKWKLMSSIL